MNVENPEFPALLNEVDGVFANARIAYSLTMVDRAMSRWEWARALDILSSLADKLATKDVLAAGFQELMLAASWCALCEQTDRAFEELSTLFSWHITRAWPRPKLTVVSDQERFIAQKRAQMPWDFAQIFDKAEQLNLQRSARKLAEILTEFFPDFPLAIYAAAHAQESLNRQAQPGSSECLAPREVSDKFLQSARLADKLSMPDLSRRARLRAAVSLLDAGRDIERARGLMREIDPAKLSRQNQIWYAAGLAKSPFWLDRVRAADQIIAVHHAAQLKPARFEEPDAQPSPLAADLEAAIRHLLRSAPLKLEALETDRFLELVELLSRGRQAATLRTNLGLRQYVEKFVEVPLSHAGEAAELMQRELSDAAQTAAEFCRAVDALSSDAKSTRPDADLLKKIEAVYPLASVVLRTLWAIQAADIASLATALGSLEGKLRLSDISPAELKPIGLIWPPLLSFLADLAERKEALASEASALKRVHQSTVEILTRWASSASRPTYGWWALSAHLLDHPAFEDPWPDYAALCVERALADNSPVDPALKADVLESLLYRACAHAPRAKLLTWLERLERVELSQ